MRDVSSLAKVNKLIENTSRGGESLNHSLNTMSTQFKLTQYTGGSKTLTKGTLQGRLNIRYNHTINGYQGFRSLGGGRASTTSDLRARSLPSVKGVRGQRHLVYALFEKFTERSIKSVMLSQEICRSLGQTEVRDFEITNHN